MTPRTLDAFYRRRCGAHRARSVLRRLPAALAPERLVRRTVRAEWVSERWKSRTCVAGSLTGTDFCLIFAP